MGYDKLINYFYKNLPNNSIEKVLIYSNNTRNKKYNIYAYNHIFFDVSFIIYNSINKLEYDINYIIKNIVGLSYNENKVIINNIKKILSKSQWKLIDLKLQDILDGDTIEEIIYKFKSYLSYNNNINQLLFFYIYENIIFCIENIHDINYIKSINIFFDGIPTYSKIIEQRKRRLKNYIESKNRKKEFDNYFKDINENIIDEDGILYDYFYYINNVFSFNKSFGPNSDLISDLENFLKTNINSKYKNCNIYFDSGINNGEADYKIFKYIKNNNINGDICIHSCDSDFLYLILLNQILNKDNKYFYIRHCNDNYELFNANKLINSLNEKYKIVNNIEYSLINNIIDFIFIIQMFENDILPINYSLSIELNLNFIFENHYNICKNKNFIIDINSEYNIDYSLLLLFFKKLKSKNTTDLIILLKNFKIPNNFINICFNELRFDIDSIINKLIIPYLGWEGNNNNNLDEDDIRLKFKNPQLQNNPIDDLNLSENSKNDLKHIMLNLFDYSDIDNYGIKKLDKYINVDDNNFQTIYNILVHNTLENRKEHQLENINDIENFKNKIKNDNCKEYFDVLISQTLILFYDFDLYSPKNKLFYGFEYSPDINSLINYLDTTNMYDITKELYLSLNNNNNIYFDFITHHLFITPYLLDNLFIKKIDELENVDSLINITKNIMKSVWFNEDSKNNFELKNINPEFFIKNCNSIINLLKSDIVKYINNNYKVLI
jgi:hypothetical protein